ncbi:MAG: type II toxin-antitoxin system PemK/MazF family toxin [Rhodospirillaceae bacterium]|nr:type II toxin-antitoxin system PemK/MazF family toxin [Rhodospirillaceae bacterium]
MASRGTWAPDRGDMIWIDCNPQVGREMRDMHPLLVLSPRVFNERTGLVIGLPMTTAPYNETNPFAVKFVGPRNTTSYVLGHQPKSFDWRARNAKPHPWKRAPADVFSAACETLNQIIAVGLER